MSKDSHGNILEESLQNLEQQQPQEIKREEGSPAKNGKTVGEEEEEEGVAKRKDVEEEKEEGDVAKKKDVEEEEECKTPTSSDHKIPTIQSCPPTPKKKVRANFHKRKFSELQFFETIRSEEVESFFRSNSESFTDIHHEPPRSMKRRCRSA